MLNIRKNEIFDAVALQATWGIRPDQVVDFQSLVGDKVDNVQGVPLIGPKIAQELLSKYDTLEGVFANVEDVAGGEAQREPEELPARRSPEPRACTAERAMCR